MRFIAREDFHSPELRSSYAKGMTYTVRPGPTHARLGELAKRWEAEGKIVFIHPAERDATIRGSDQPAKPSLVERIKSWITRT